MLEKLKDPKFKLCVCLVAKTWNMAEYSYDYEEALKDFDSDVKELADPSSPWYNEQHHGECNGFAGPCITCNLGAYIKETEELLKKYE